jgi:hypothetical protein
MTADPREDEDRPWERPGGARRDCEPHRGPLLVWLGRASLICGFVTLCSGLPGLVGLPLGAVALRMSANDLREMQRGQMDPAGEDEARWSKWAAIVGIALNCAGMLFWGLLAAGLMLWFSYT